MEIIGKQIFMFEKIYNKRSLRIIIKLLFFAGAVSVLAISFFYIFRLPYTGDDRTNSMTKGIVWYSGQTVRQHTYWVEKGWLDRGRFFPLGFYSRALFYYLPDLFSYRIFQILLNIAVCASFAALIQKITKRWYISVFALLMPAVFFQTRDYHDAITGFHGFLQLVAIFLFLALIFQIIAFEKKSLLFTIISGVFFLGSLLLYEVSYSFAAIFITVTLLYSKKAKERILSVLPHFIAIIATLIPTIYYKMNAVGAAYEGVTFSLQIDKIIQTFSIQLLSAVPLSYMVMFPEIFQNAKVHVRHLTAIDIFFYLSFAILLFGCILAAKKHCSKKAVEQTSGDVDHQETHTEERKGNFRNLLVVGFMLWLAPAGIVALSIRYQEELKPGIGYLPVYIQYFGGICIAASLVFYLLEKIKPAFWKIIISAGCAFCFTIAVVMTQSGHEIARREIAKDDLQTLSQYALEQGIMDDVEENAQFLMLQGGLAPELLTEYFVSQYANQLRIVQPVPKDFEEETVSMNKADDIVTLYPENLYVFYTYGGTENGVVILAKAKAVDFRVHAEEMLFKDRIVQVYLEEAKGFALGSDTTILSLFVQEGEDEFTQVQAGMMELSAAGDSISAGNVISDDKTGVKVQRISEIFSPSDKEKQFSPYQADSFIFTVEAGEDPILLRHFSCWG